MLPALLLLSSFPAALASGVGVHPDPESVHRLAIAALEHDPALRFNPTAVFVRFRAGDGEEQRAELRARVGAGMLVRYEIVPDLELIDCRIGVEQALATLSPDVVYASPDYVRRTDNDPNDTLYGQCWGQRNTGQVVPYSTAGTPGSDVRARNAWRVFTGDPNLKVAIIDTGIQTDHPDLAANMWVNPGEIPGDGLDNEGDGYADDVFGYDFYSHEPDPMDEQGHGTHTAGTVGAVGDNGVGVAGMNWHCKLVALRFIGPFGGYDSDAVLCYQFAQAHGVKVSNNSYGGPGFSQPMYDAIGALASIGHLFVVAAGNDSRNIEVFPTYPAAYDLANTICVAATDNHDERASFSNWGPSAVDVGAPGVGVLSTYKNGLYVYLQGTSMATPHVAGLTALVYGQNPSWSAAQVKSRLLSTARPVASLAGKCVSGGVIDAGAAIVGTATNQSPSVTITLPSSNLTVPVGTPLSFAATASDPENGNLTPTIVWRSSIQGQLGIGGSMQVSNLFAGVHTIAATVDDAGGFGGYASVQVTVSANGPVPYQPGQPFITSIGQWQAEIIWAEVSNNETGFELQREERIGAIFTNTTTVGTTSANETLFIDVVPHAGRYRWRVRAFNANGYSSWGLWRIKRIQN